MFWRRKRPRCGRPEWDDLAFSLDDSEPPLPIRRTALELSGGRLDWHLYFHDTADGGEWLLFDEADELIEVLSLEA